MDRFNLLRASNLNLNLIFDDFVFLRDRNV
jgi:hypothetical protein